MNPQLSISFSSSSPINKLKLGGQNKKLFEYLEKGNTINVFSEARKTLGIGYLNSRIADLRCRSGIIIHDRMIEVNGTHCKEYSLTPFPFENKN